jgi:hypothetical protein
MRSKLTTFFLETAIDGGADVIVNPEIATF